jgi:DNA-binding transcriptional LysR family regulator
VSKENLDFSAIRIFVTTTNQGSFVAGAKKLGLTRSAVGKAIGRLESYLGIRLLHRTTRKMSLTTDGQKFYESCVQILENLEEIEANIRQDKPIPKGVLRLTLTQAFGRIVVLPLLKQFLETWPQLGAEISFSDRIVDIVEEGFDLGIRIGEFEPDSQLISRVITKANLCLCAAPSYLNENGTPQITEDLKNHQILIYGLKSNNYNFDLYSVDGGLNTIKGVGRLKFDSGEAIKDAAVEGLGIAYLPDFLVEKDIQSGKLVQILTTYKSDMIPIYVIYPNRNNLPIRVRLFIDVLTKHLNYN